MQEFNHGFYGNTHYKHRIRTYCVPIMQEWIIERMGTKKIPSIKEGNRSWFWLFVIMSCLKPCNYLIGRFCFLEAEYRNLFHSTNNF